MRTMAAFPQPCRGSTGTRKTCTGANLFLISYTLISVRWKPPLAPRIAGTCNRWTRCAGGHC